MNDEKELRKLKADSKYGEPFRVEVDFPTDMQRIYDSRGRELYREVNSSHNVAARIIACVNACEGIATEDLHQAKTEGAENAELRIRLRGWFEGWDDAVTDRGHGIVYWCCGTMASTLTHSDACPIWGDGGLLNLVGDRAARAKRLGVSWIESTP